MTDSQVDDKVVDLGLIDRILARDSGAIAALYDRHHRLLYGLILRILQDRSEAEEVLQEVFVLVWTRAETYNASLGVPAAWLVRIARNRAIDRLRSNQVRTRAVEGALPPEPVESPEAAAAASERQRAVARALRLLPPEQRDLIELAYFLGLTQSELAERFGLPLGTVKTRIRTGMLTLRRELQHVAVASDGDRHYKRS
jgi:RNA polymerase sigma-70 factor (ECF subfamily)